RRLGELDHGLRVDGGEDRDDRAFGDVSEAAARGEELAQLAVVAHADEDHLGSRGEAARIGAPRRLAAFHRDALAGIDIVDAHVEPPGGEVPHHRHAHAPGADEADLRDGGIRGGVHRFCVSVSRSAGCPAFTFAMARFSARATFFGSSIGPSPYQPIACASLPKSGSGSLMSMPMCARSTGVPRSFAMRIWCSQSL